MYTDIPTLEQWKKDTTVNGKREPDLLAWIDGALEDWNTANKDKDLQANPKVMAFLENYLGYQTYRIQTAIKESGSKELKTALDDLWKVVFNKLKATHKLSKENEIFATLEQKVTKAMLEDAYLKDKKASALHLDPSQLWKYRVHVQSGQLMQLPWWDSSVTKSSNLTVVSTLDCKKKVGIGGYRNVTLERLTKYQEVIVQTNGACELLFDPDQEVYCEGRDLTANSSSNNGRTYIPLTADMTFYLKVYGEGDDIFLLAREVQSKELIKTGFDKVTKPDEESLTAVQVPEKCAKYQIAAGSDIEDVDNVVLLTTLFKSYIDGWTSNYGAAAGQGWGGYVLGVDRELYMTKHTTGHGSIFHSYYFSGKPVLTAGALMVDSNGRLMAISNCSGHYRPNKYSLLHALNYFRQKKVDLSNVMVVAVSGGGFGSVTSFEFYSAEEFLATRGTCEPKVKFDHNAYESSDQNVIRNHIGKNRKILAADNSTTFDFTKDVESLEEVLTCLCEPA